MGRGGKRLLAKPDHGFGIAGCFDDHRDAQGVDLALQVKGVFRLIRHLRDEACGPVEQFQNMGQVEEPSIPGHPGCHERQIRVCRNCLCREHAEHAFVELPLFSVHQGMAVLGHQADSGRRFVPPQRVLQRLLKQALSGIPGAGPSMEPRDLAGRVPLLQPALQEAAEEMVVAIPAALVVQGHGEQIVLLQPLQPRLSVHFGVSVPDQRFAQRAAHPVEDRGLQEEVRDGGGVRASTSLIR